MIKIQRNWPFFLFLAIIQPRAAAALPYEDRRVTAVDVDVDVVRFWVSGDTSGFADCRSNGDEWPAITCGVDDAHCKVMQSLAIAATLSGRLVDFDIDGCLGAMNRAVRFRLDRS